MSANRRSSRSRRGRDGKSPVAERKETKLAKKLITLPPDLEEKLKRLTEHKTFSKKSFSFSCKSGELRYIHRGMIETLTRFTKHQENLVASLSSLEKEIYEWMKEYLEDIRKGGDKMLFRSHRAMLKGLYNELKRTLSNKESEIDASNKELKHLILDLRKKIREQEKKERAENLLDKVHKMYGPPQAYKKSSVTFSIKEGNELYFYKIDGKFKTAKYVFMHDTEVYSPYYKGNEEVENKHSADIFDSQQFSQESLDSEVSEITLRQPIEDAMRKLMIDEDA